MAPATGSTVGIDENLVLDIYFEDDFHTLYTIDAAINFILSSFSLGIIRVVERERVKQPLGMKSQEIYDTFLGNVESSFFRTIEDLDKLRKRVYNDSSSDESKKVSEMSSNFGRAILKYSQRSKRGKMSFGDFPEEIGLLVRNRYSDILFVKKISNQGSLELALSYVGLLTVFGMQNQPFIGETIRESIEIIKTWMGTYSKTKNVVAQTEQISPIPLNFIPLMRRYSHVEMEYNEAERTFKLKLKK